MSAQLIYDTAPLGSLIRYSNGEPRPPERFTRKVKAWLNDNGVGRLTDRTPPHLGPGYVSSGSFCLHIGNYGSGDFIAIVIRRHYDLRSALHFEIVEPPKPGMVRVLTTFRGRDELKFLASDMKAAESWMARNRHSGAWTQLVTQDDPVILPEPTGMAA